MLGGIELGGTKVICVAGPAPDAIVAEQRIDTGDPGETLTQVVDFFRALPVPIVALGVASFGPIELRRTVRAFGTIARTPKLGWSGTDIVRPLTAALSCPVGFDTDVNAAALAEGRYGAAMGLSSFVYVTVGTGIGGGALVGNQTLHGLVHPEMGHVAVPREEGDDFGGVCPFHRDCLEGFASGEAIRQRYGARAEALEGAVLQQAVALEAAYLASGVRTIAYLLAPERIVFGGSVALLPGLLGGIRSRLVDRLGGYPGIPDHTSESFVAPAALGSRAGPVGALLLASDLL